VKITAGVAMLPGMSAGERIKAARTALGWSQSRLAEAVGVSRPAVTQWESGATTPDPDNAALIGRALGRSAHWIIYGEEMASRLMPVRGEVAAGVWREVEDLDLDPIPVAAHPDFPAAAQYGLLVRGNSMNLIARDSEYLHVVDVLDTGFAPRPGDLVVVQKRRHGRVEATVKRLAANGTGLALKAESDDPRYQGDLPLGPSDDETEIVISGIVIGKYTPIFRGRT